MAECVEHCRVPRAKRKNVLVLSFQFDPKQTSVSRELVSQVGRPNPSDLIYFVWLSLSKEKLTRADLDDERSVAMLGWEGPAGGARS